MQNVLTWLAQPACPTYTMQHPANKAEGCGTALPVVVLLRARGPLSHCGGSKAKRGQMTAAGAWKQGRPAQLVIRTGAQGGRWRG